MYSPFFHYFKILLYDCFKAIDLLLKCIITKRRFKCHSEMGVTAGFCALKARFIPLVTRRTAESVMTKFGHSFWKRWDLLEEGSKEWNNTTIKRPRAAASANVSFLLWRVGAHFMPPSFFAQCFQVWFVFTKLKHFQSFKKRLWTSIFDDCRPKFVLYFFLLAF